jgi:hypothetical protein
VFIKAIEAVLRTIIDKKIYSILDWEDLFQKRPAIKRGGELVNDLKTTTSKKTKNVIVAALPKTTKKTSSTMILRVTIHRSKSPEPDLYNNIRQEYIDNFPRPNNKDLLLY